MVAASRMAVSGLIQLLEASIRVFSALTAPRLIGGTRNKKALLIGINYEDHQNENHKLKGPQADVESVKQLLINKFNFLEHNIIVLSDKKGTDKKATPDGRPDQFTPTKENIMRELENNFVNKEDTNTDYFFVYSGHSDQRNEEVPEGKLPVEEDGKEEFIIPCDALKSDAEYLVVHENTINDKKLNESLVKRLGKGSQLVAIFDSCHSGTLLNLKHHRCNRSGDLRSLIQDTARRVLIEPLHARFSSRNAPISGQLPTIRRSSTQIGRENAPVSGQTPPIRKPSPEVSIQDAPASGPTPTIPKSSTHISIQNPSALEDRPPVRKSATLLSTASRDSTGWTGYNLPGGGKMWCTGFCPRIPMFDKPQAVCISACRDSETLIESTGGGTIIPAIVALLSAKQTPTYREVMFAARSSLGATHQEILDALHAQRKNKKCHWHFNHLWKFHRKCVTPQEQTMKDLARQKCDPQLSSRKPLNTKTILRI